MNKTFVKIFGIIEIIGGTLGILSFVLQVFANKILDSQIQNLMIYLFILLFYVLTLIGGIYLIKYKRKGYYFSIVSNFIQLVGLDIWGMIFIVSSLGYFFITYVYGQGLTFDILFGGTSLIKYVPGREELKLGINLFALIKIIILLYINAFLKEHQSKDNQ